MRGPKFLSRQSKVTLYQTLALRPLLFSEKDIALYTQHARGDARLAEVVTEHIRDYWWKYDPRTLNQALKRQPWPAAIRPMLNQILEMCASPDDKIKLEFRKWAGGVVLGIANVPGQLYFEVSTAPRSPAEDLQVLEALESFKKVGFFSKEVLFNKGNPKEIKGPPTEPNTIIGTEDLLKLQIFRSITPKLKTLKLRDIEAKIGVDRTTASIIKSGRLGRMTLAGLIRFKDKLDTLR